MLDSLTLLRAMNGIHEEDVVTAGNIYMNGKSTHRRGRRLLTLALAAALVLALGVAAYSTGLRFSGWGGNMEIQSEQTAGGIENTVYVHTENMTQPVRFEDGRMIFIVNGEHIDINSASLHKLSALLVMLLDLPDRISCEEARNIKNEVHAQNNHLNRDSYSPRNIN